MDDRAETPRDGEDQLSSSERANTKHPRQVRRQRLLGELPPELQGKVSLHNVEAVARLSPEAQQTLAQAFSAGLRPVRKAVRLLLEQPGLPLVALLKECGDGIPSQDAAQLAGLLQLCFKDMPRLAAESLAQDHSLAGPLGLVRARRDCWESPYFSSEIVIVVLCAFLLQTAEQLDAIIRERFVYQQILRQCDIPWPLHGRRGNEPSRAHHVDPENRSPSRSDANE